MGGGGVNAVCVRGQVDLIFFFLFWYEYQKVIVAHRFTPRLMDKLGEGGGGGGGGVNGGFGDLQQLLLGQHFWFWPQKYKQLRYWDIFNHFKIGGFLISEENVNNKKKDVSFFVISPTSIIIGVPVQHVFFCRRNK